MNEKKEVLRLTAYTPWGIDFTVSDDATIEELSDGLAAVINLIVADNRIAEAWEIALEKVGWVVEEVL